MEIIDWNKSLIEPFIDCMQTPIIMVSNVPSDLTKLDAFSVSFGRTTLSRE